MPITININSGADYEPVSEGVHSAVLADIVDLGVVETSFGPKHKVQFVWMTDEADEGGRTKYVFKRYTASLHEKASLRKDVKQILGKDIAGNSFDLESLIGTQKGLIIQHSEGTNGKVYANIAGYLKPPAKVAIPSDFVRRKDRTDAAPKKPAASTGGGTAAARAILAPAVRTASQATVVDDELGF